jgi:hypothetical protein
MGARSATSHVLIIPTATDKRMLENHQFVMRSRKFDQELIKIDQDGMKSMACQVPMRSPGTRRRSQPSDCSQDVQGLA